MAYRTEFEFNLPMGLDDGAGNVHRKGLMRLATARDEIVPLQDPKVRKNQAYLIVVLLSRVITRLGELREVTPDMVEGLYAEDLRYLQGFYQQINRSGTADIEVSCPHCDGGFHLDLGEIAQGES